MVGWVLCDYSWWVVWVWFAVLIPRVILGVFRFVTLQFWVLISCWLFYLVSLTWGLGFGGLLCLLFCLVLHVDFGLLAVDCCLWPLLWIWWFISCLFCFVGLFVGFGFCVLLIWLFRLLFLGVTRRVFCLRFALGFSLVFSASWVAWFYVCGWLFVWRWCFVCVNVVFWFVCLSYCCVYWCVVLVVLCWLVALFTWFEFVVLLLVCVFVFELCPIWCCVGCVALIVVWLLLFNLLILIVV